MKFQQVLIISTLVLFPFIANANDNADELICDKVDRSQQHFVVGESPVIKSGIHSEVDEEWTVKRVIIVQKGSFVRLKNGTKTKEITFSNGWQCRLIKIYED